MPHEKVAKWLETWGDPEFEALAAGMKVEWSADRLWPISTASACFFANVIREIADRVGSARSGSGWHLLSDFPLLGQSVRSEYREWLSRRSMRNTSYDTQSKKTCCYLKSIPRPRATRGRSVNDDSPPRDQLRRFPQGRHPGRHDRRGAAVPGGAQTRLPADHRFRPGHRAEEIVGADHRATTASRNWSGGRSRRSSISRRARSGRSCPRCSPSVFPTPRAR